MKAKELLALIRENFKPNEEVVLSNRMGAPAYDYEGQRFGIGYDPDDHTLTIKEEIKTK